jgi:hypothetical protein
MPNLSKNRPQDIISPLSDASMPTLSKNRPQDIISPLSDSALPTLSKRVPQPIISELVNINIDVPKTKENTMNASSDTQNTARVPFFNKIPANQSDNSEFLCQDNQQHNLPEALNPLNSSGMFVNAIETLFNGVDFKLENGNIVNQSGQKITNFFLEIKSETIIYSFSKNEYCENSKYNIRVWIKNKPYDCTVFGEELYSGKWLRKVAGGKALIQPQGNKGNQFNIILCELINANNYPVYKYFITNGWYNLPGLGYCYVYNKGIVGLKQSVYSAANQHNFDYTEEAVGSNFIFNNILRMMTKVCNKSSISIVLMLYSHLGLLTTLFELAEFPIKFIVSLIGVTNSRKTSLALAFTKIFNRSSAPKPDFSFESTNGGIETAFSQYHDSIVVIDDLKPSDSKERQKAMSSKLELIVRAYGDRVAKVRMNDYNPNGKEVYYPVYGCCLITGEYLDAVPSTLARIVNINIEKNDVNNDELRYFQENYNILTTHIYDFISYITVNFASTVMHIKKRMPEVRNNAYKDFDIPRYAESYSTFMVVAEIFLQYAFDRHFFDCDQANSFLAECGAAIRSILTASDFSIVDHNPGIQSLQAISHYMTAGLIRVYYENQSPSNGDEFYAFIEDDFICIKLDTVYKLLIKYLHSLNSYPSVTKSRQLIPHLKSLSVIYTEDNNGKIRHTHKLRKRLTQDRFLFIYKDRMNEILQNENLY